jgi:mitochondrial fission protein ELM1
MSAAKAESAYKAWQGKFTIKDNQPAIVALLGGTVDGKGYLLGEARSIAEYVAGKARQVGAYVLFSNSPRSSPQDTQDFMDVLCNAGCENAFFPFDIKNQNNETPYRAMLGMVARNPANAIIVTGDSVSMPCEIAKVVPPQQIYIYPVSCQNQQNNEFVTWMACSGRAAVVNTKEGMEKRVSGTMAKSTMDAAGQVADVVLELIKQWINV